MSGVKVNGSTTPTLSLKLTGTWRVQNRVLFRKYWTKKQAIREKNIPALPSTQVLSQSGGINTMLLDAATNEFYMWCYAPNADDVIHKGGPIERAASAGS